ncbi:MAG: nucleotidyltransferase domain-containing protein [Candidatus Bathyarchaeia archaeon]
MRILRRINIERSEEVFRKIESYAKEVIKELNPKLIILFGSFASGEINEGSDIDILVVADFKEDFLERIKILMNLNRFSIPIEPIGYTEEEFEEMRKRNSLFVEEVLKKGKILFKING